ncbi:MAG: chromate resistance protein [Nitrospirae bacterium]|nr:chromate resistance protein [Nitrospirota bacterium]
MLHNLGYRWLLFFYSISAKPVSGRVKIWRRLSKAGAVQLKDAVYVLPYSAEHYEFFQWLSSEAVSMGGEALFVKAEKIEMIDDASIIKLFEQHRKKDYAVLESHIDEIEAKITQPLKDAAAKKLSDRFHKCLKEFNDIRKIDFFPAEEEALTGKIEVLREKINNITRAGGKSNEPTAIVQRNIEDYQGKTWVTRELPFVDRMSCAWLIKRFIDKGAVIGIAGEGGPGTDTVSFDVMGGEFTHVGSYCTFEVLVKAFNLKDKVLKKIAEIVHEIDIRDDEYKSLESPGVEEILTGIKKTASSDIEALERGAAIFELLYLSKTR